MKVLIACEYSGRVRDAFIEMGHDAISCDILPTESPGPHFQGDVSIMLEKEWDLIIAHPPCTRLCNSGVRWLYERNLWNEMKEAAVFFRSFLLAKSTFIAVENPVIHSHALNVIGRSHDFSVQPYEHGEPYTKRTCFWVKNLPHLKPTNIVNERIEEVHLMPPGKDRAKKRSLTYQGIANAMAKQWGNLNKSYTNMEFNF